MKILLVTHHLDNLAGSELFTLNLAVELKKRGHQVFVFSPIAGEVAGKIRAAQIRVSENIEDFENEKLDLIHAQHNTTAILTRSLFPDTPMVFMAHGILPELEQTPSVELDIARYLAVSEEIKRHLIQSYAIPGEKIEVIRNFVDTGKFFPKRPVNSRPTRLLVLSNHYEAKSQAVIEKACGDLDISVFHAGLPENPVENVEDYVNDADIVVTLGRGALEAMACERNVIVYDIHGGDGMINEKNFYEIRQNNFSGRKYKIRYDPGSFKKEIQKYNPDIGKKLRALIIRENSTAVILDKLEEIYRECSAEKVDRSQIKKGQLFRELVFLEKSFSDMHGLYSQTQELDKIIREKEREIISLKSSVNDLRSRDQELDKIIREKEKEINFIKSSRFWKLRNRYIKFKNQVGF